MTTTISVYSRKRHSGGWLEPDARAFNMLATPQERLQIVAVVGPAGNVMVDENLGPGLRMVGNRVQFDFSELPLAPDA